MAAIELFSKFDNWNRMLCLQRPGPIYQCQHSQSALPIHRRRRVVFCGDRHTARECRKSANADTQFQCEIELMWRLFLGRAAHPIESILMRVTCTVEGIITSSHFKSNKLLNEKWRNSRRDRDSRPSRALPHESYVWVCVCFLRERARIRFMIGICYYYLFNHMLLPNTKT